MQGVFLTSPRLSLLFAFIRARFMQMGLGTPLPIYLQNTLCWRELKEMEMRDVPAPQTSKDCWKLFIDRATISGHKNWKKKKILLVKTVFLFGCQLSQPIYSSELSLLFVPLSFVPLSQISSEFWVNTEGKNKCTGIHQAVQSDAVNVDEDCAWAKKFSPARRGDFYS